MNFRCHSLILPLIILCLCISSAYGQAIEPIPAAAKTAPDASPHRGEIEGFIQAQVELLKDSSRPQRQSTARDALVSEMMAPGNQPATPSYLDIYADALNRSLAAEVAQHQDLRVRLLGAIVAARAAERANNTRLVPVVETLLADNNWTVVLWSMKASRHLMPQVLANQLLVRQNRLIGPVAVAAQNHPRGPVVLEAYGALVANLLEPGRQVDADMVRRVVAAMHGLFEMRLGQYRQGIPESPQAEDRATLFLTEGRIWQIQTEQDRRRTAHLIAEHISLVGQHLAAGRGARDQLIRMLQQSAGATVVMARAIGNNSLEEAANGLRNVRLVTPVDEIAAHTQATHDAILAAFPNGNARVADVPAQPE